MIGRILLTLAVFAFSGFVLLVVVGLWDRYEQETEASQAGFLSDQHARAAAEARPEAGRMQLAPQLGPKLVGTGAVGSTNQGMSVARSGDGDTAVVGGWRAEAAWVFPRSGGVWTQQGKKLVGAGAVGSARQGMSVALSADGNTAIVGGWSDNNKTGAAWAFTRSGGVRAQQGKKLVGSDAVGTARPRISDGLSAVRNAAIFGGPGDNPWDRS